MENVTFSIFIILFGIYVIWDVIKHPFKEWERWKLDSRRYIIGTACIIGGIFFFDKRFISP